MLRYGVCKSSSPFPLPSPSNYMDSPDDPPNRKTLTPQRKHHKLLKDGSEVWSQEVEKIFVDGLHKYWESPWATYSRGRSRWRNQFLVEHLKKNGIDRSKKQVASHIQVLRNMWRGEPEFHLVAGGEELFQENGLLASPKSNSSTESPEPLPPPSLDSPDWRDSWSSTSSVPDFSALNLRSDIVPSSSGPLLSPPVPVPPLAESPVAPTVPLSTSPHSAYATITPAMARAHSRSSVKLEPLLLDPTLFNLPQGSLPETSDYLHAPPPNRLCGMNLWTDSVPLAMIDVDQLTSAPNQPSPPFRILLRFQVRLAPSSINSPAGLQGVQGMMSFASQWTTSAKCHTKSWAGKTRMSHEIGALEQVSPFQQQASTSGSAPSSMVIASLPDSVLTRCSWLDPNVQTITQQIVVDREVLALIIYSVDRTASSVSPPSVELVGFHKYPWHTQPSQPLASPPISPVSPSLFPSAPGAAVAPQTPLFARPLSTGDDVPLSFALDFNRPPTMRAPNATARHPPRPFR